MSKICDYFMKKSKKYFLYNKIKEYEYKLNDQSIWTYHKIKQYEKRWKRLVQKYDYIYIYGIEFVGIGETIARLFMFLEDKTKRYKNTFHIILPTFYKDYYTGGVVNKKIFDVFGERIHFVTEGNLGFWKYCVLFHSDKISTEFYDKYKYRDASVVFNIKVGKPLLPYTKEIREYADKKMQQMGVVGEYICIHAREAATKTNNFIGEYADTSVLDADINSYKQACAYMKKLGYQAIRLGKDESKKCEIEDVIDYANHFYDELMDFYLIGNCKFLIGCSSGITAISAFWGRPVLQTNLMVWCYGQEALPWTEYDLYIPKKFYSKRKERLLNLYEMWEVSLMCDRQSVRFEKEKIELIDNTEEEILKAAVEMNEKLDYTWKITEEEIKCMDKYWQILNIWKNNHRVAYASKANGGLGLAMYTRPISYSYLRENMYLLDVKEIYEKS